MSSTTQAIPTISASSTLGALSTPLGPTKKTLDDAIAGFSSQQLIWASGYLAGLAQQGVAQQPLAQPPSVSASSTEDKVTVLFGSQTGNGEGVATQVAQKLATTGIGHELIDLKDYRAAQLKKARYLVLVISTHGEGEPPDDAEDFYDFLFSDRAPQLPQLNYAVLALGDSSYDQFCATGAQIDERLCALGATRFADRIDCDVDYQNDAQTWVDEVGVQLDQVIDRNNDTPVALHAVPDKPRFDQENPLATTVEVNQKITGRHSSKDVRHIELSLGNATVPYLPGDSLAVLARNSAAAVELLTTALNLDLEETVIGPDDKQASLREVLTEQREITQLSPPVIARYAEVANVPTLQTLLDDKPALRQYIDAHHLLDLVDEFPGQLEAQALVDMLRPLSPREYSIASSPAIYDDEIHLTVAPVRFPGSGNETRHGVASTYLSDRLAPGDELKVFVKRNDRFRLPTDPTTPIILIGPGTGIAPFRAFLQQREAEGATGDNWLFFGDRQLHHDFLYQTEWQTLIKTGLLTRLDVAFSRDQSEKIYVQDRMLANSEALFQWLERGAHIYVCGDASRMAKDVDAALLKIVATAGNHSAEDAATYVKQLRREGRYQRDVY